MTTMLEKRLVTAGSQGAGLGSWSFFVQKKKTHHVQICGRARISNNVVAIQFKSQLLQHVNIQSVTNELNLKKMSRNDLPGPVLCPKTVPNECWNSRNS